MYFALSDGTCYALRGNVFIPLNFQYIFKMRAILEKEKNICTTE